MWFHHAVISICPGRSNRKEISLAWETWWRSAVCGKSSVQRSNCFLATLPTPRFVTCFWMGGLSEFWSLFGGDHGQKFQKPTEIWENHVRFEGFENPPRIHSISNFAVLFPFEKYEATFGWKKMKAPSLHGLPRALVLYSEIWNSQYFEGKTSNARFCMVLKNTPDSYPVPGGGQYTHFWKSRYSTPWIFPKPDIQLLEKNKTVYQPPGIFSKPHIQPLAIKPLATGQGPSIQSSERTRERCRRTGTGKS